MSILNLLHSLLDRNIPRIYIRDQGTLFYKKHGKSFSCDMELTQDGIDLRFGEISTWDDGTGMSDTDRSMIKSDIEKNYPILGALDGISSMLIADFPAGLSTVHQSTKRIEGSRPPSPV